MINLSPFLLWLLSSCWCERLCPRFKLLPTLLSLLRDLCSFLSFFFLCLPMILADCQLNENTGKTSTTDSYNYIKLQ